MQVLVDTSIWSLALRRQKGSLSETETAQVALLQELIRDSRARLIGPIRQELLSGIKEPEQFKKLRTLLRAFPDEAITTDDYEQAAHWSNQCRRRGVAGSSVDFLICAVSIARGWLVFTRDADFLSYAKLIQVRLQVAPE